MLKVQLSSRLLLTITCNCLIHFHHAFFSPILVLLTATLGFLGIGGYRVYKATGNRGGQKLSFFLIHTRLAAQGFAVAVLGSLVLYSLGERAYNRVVLGKKPEEN